MNWIELTDESQLATITEESYHQPVVIYKHSTRCGTSDMVKMRLERQYKPSHIKFYYLDLIRYRSVSNKIAEIFSVYHESPQVLLIKNGDCVYDESHYAIMMDDIEAQAGTA